MNSQKYLFSLLFSVSLVIHAGLYFLSTKIFIRSAMEIEQDIRKAFRMRDITFLREVKARKPHYQIRTIQFPDMERQILQEAQKLIFDEDPYKDKLVDSTEDVLRDKKMEKNANFFEPQEDSWDILHGIESMASEEILISERLSYVPVTEKGFPDLSEDISVLGERAGQKIEEEDKWLSGQMSRVSFEQEEGVFVEREAAEADKPDVLSSVLDISDYEGSLMSSSIKPYDKVTTVDNLDRFIDVSIDHAFLPEENAGYFKVELKMKNVYTGLGAFPKDVVFVLDISRSMEDEQVGKIIQAIEKIVIGEMDSEDRFNIVLFSQTNEFFSPEMVKRGFADFSPKLTDFFKNVTTRGQTDVYGSLSQVMAQWDAVRDRAGLLVLISDGRSTRGVQDPAEVIRKITVLNDEKWRIYCFGNERADKYLLDMLAYMNRGYSLYAKNFIRLDREMMSLFDEIRHPVVLNVKFQHTGMEVADIYPSVIPDLFEGGKVIFYGKYKSRDSLFSGRIVGRTLQGEKEIVFLTRFKDIQESRNGEEIKKNYERAREFEKQKPVID
ncbi:MAG: VWA domain-containing protein [Candidatus Aureabacteria bacterium]|nr:VWA domain-containing protein [Candidatus Auribacterota bacterium]